ncbi:hypothetical protein Tco_1239338, partial [Tanacetum coccineum]
SVWMHPRYSAGSWDMSDECRKLDENEIALSELQRLSPVASTDKAVETMNTMAQLIDGIYMPDAYTIPLSRVSQGQSLDALRPSRLCARARSVDDMPFRTQAYMEYIRWVFCKLYGRPKVHHLVCPTKRHGFRLRSFQEFVSSHDWIPQLAHLFVGDTRWRDGE